MKAGARKQAMIEGHKTYFSSSTCKHEHRAERRTATGKCLECERIAQATPKMRAYHRQISMSPKYIEQRRQYRASIAGTEKFKEATRAVHLKNKYGITLEQHKEMYDAQHGKCAICSSQMEIHNRQVSDSCHVDHNHKTGKIRKLLCGKCNKMIGLANENIETLQSAIQYLQQH
jgi:hypothetical protein